MTTLFDRARSWIAGDPSAADRAELEGLLTAAAGEGESAEAAARELADRLNGTLQFGTAGLRGALGAGSNRMNRAVVIRAAAGLSAYLRELVGEGFKVVIGCDARHGSEQFARDTAAVVTAAGGQAELLPARLPTPVLAFAVLFRGADAGVMVTASHNPPQDNGYKVYLGGRAAAGAGRGVQIVSPHDAGIAAQIDAAPPAKDVPRAESGWSQAGEEIREAYLQAVAELVPAQSTSKLQVVHTAMHGVGSETFLRAMERCGFTNVHSVPEQRDPDPDFPTVAFPNPEEPGALELSFQLAEQLGADLIIASDPDADRCSAAIPGPGGAGWRQLSGDEVGWLLGHQSAGLARLQGQGVLACSIVSSRMLERIAAAHGITHEYTLTGFKWISRVEGLTFGYEEALGYCVDPDKVRDKDGISAGIRLALLASELAAKGETLQTLLDQLALEHGVHATNPLTIRVEDLSFISAAMARLRAEPPLELAGSRVVEAVDLAVGGWNDLPPTDGLYWVTADGDRVVVRPSGTEPKLKCYLESRVPVPHGTSPGRLPELRAAATSRVAAVRADMERLVSA